MATGNSITLLGVIVGASTSIIGSIFAFWAMVKTAEIKSKSDLDLHEKSRGEEQKRSAYEKLMADIYLHAEVIILLRTKYNITGIFYEWDKEVDIKQLRDNSTQEKTKLLRLKFWSYQHCKEISEPTSTLVQLVDSLALKTEILVKLSQDEQQENIQMHLGEIHKVCDEVRILCNTIEDKLVAKAKNPNYSDFHNT